MCLLLGLKRISLIALLLLLPISVSAGLVDTLNSFFFRGANAEGLNSKNVQNMALLVAASDPMIGSAKAPTVEDNALVPEAGPVGGASSIAGKPGSDQISVYVVREGDTISQIAEMYGVSVNTIKWGNDLTSNTLKEGQTLVILPISGIKHTVAKGDTIQSIAKKYKGDADEILAFNNIEKGDALVPGSVIIVPDGEMMPASSSGSSGSSSSGSSKPTKDYSGYYGRPIVGGTKTQGIHGYNGVDIGAPAGTPILAAADGEVIVSRSGGYNGGYGSYIVIKHANGTQTLYAHASSISVSMGDKVIKGETIGGVGNTGKSTGPHLHFEVRGAKNPL